MAYDPVILSAVCNADDTCTVKLALSSAYTAPGSAPAWIFAYEAAPTSLTSVPFAQPTTTLNSDANGFIQYDFPLSQVLGNVSTAWHDLVGFGVLYTGPLLFYPYIDAPILFNPFVGITANGGNYAWANYLASDPTTILQQGILYWEISAPTGNIDGTISQPDSELQASVTLDASLIGGDTLTVGIYDGHTGNILNIPNPFYGYDWFIIDANTGAIVDTPSGVTVIPHVQVDDAESPGYLVTLQMQNTVGYTRTWDFPARFALQPGTTLTGVVMMRGEFLLSALSDGTNVNVYRFNNDLASRETVFTVANAMHPSLTVNQSGNLTLTCYDRTSGVSSAYTSLDYGETFAQEMGIDIWNGQGFVRQLGTIQALWAGGYAACCIGQPILNNPMSGDYSAHANVYFKYGATLSELQSASETIVTAITFTGSVFVDRGTIGSAISNSFWGPGSLGRIFYVSQDHGNRSANLTISNGTDTLWQSADYGHTWTHDMSFTGGDASMRQGQFAIAFGEYFCAINSDLYNIVSAGPPIQINDAHIPGAQTFSIVPVLPLTVGDPITFTYQDGAGIWQAVGTITSIGANGLLTVNFTSWDGPGTSISPSSFIQVNAANPPRQVVYFSSSETLTGWNVTNPSQQVVVTKFPLVSTAPYRTVFALIPDFSNRSGKVHATNGYDQWFVSIDHGATWQSN